MSVRFDYLMHSGSRQKSPNRCSLVIASVFGACSLLGIHGVGTVVGEDAAFPSGEMIEDSQGLSLTAPAQISAPKALPKTQPTASPQRIAQRSAADASGEAGVDGVLPAPKPPSSPHAPSKLPSLEKLPSPERLPTPEKMPSPERLPRPEKLPTPEKTPASPEQLSGQSSVPSLLPAPKQKRAPERILPPEKKVLPQVAPPHEAASVVPDEAQAVDKADDESVMDSETVLDSEAVTDSESVLIESDGSNSSGDDTSLQQAWAAQVRMPILRYNSHEPLTLAEAIHLTLAHSPEIKVLRADVGIAVAEITKQRAAFDWNSFLQSRWDDLNAPVASDLDGAQVRLLNSSLDNRVGILRRTQTGGVLDLSQGVNFADSNSQFFNPRDQALTRMGLEYQQPLMRDAGNFVTTSVIQIAVANAEASHEELIEGLQSHVLEMITAFWELVARRGELVIQKASFDRAAKTFHWVENRGTVDIGPAQSARSEATLAARKTDLLRAEYAVVFAQERVLRLMLGPAFQNTVDVEMIPLAEMFTETREADSNHEQQLALQYRPEIRRTLKRIKQASIEQGVAKNQLLPALGLTLSVSNAGLRGDRRLNGALSDQFNIGDASYGAGIDYALPVGNAAAKANLRQSVLRTKRLKEELEAVVAEVTLETRNATHGLALAGQERALASREMELATRELEIIETRYRLLIDGDNVATLYLDNLLQTQERLALAEARFINATVRYSQAEFALQRANGLLLREATPASVDVAP